MAGVHNEKVGEERSAKRPRMHAIDYFSHGIVELPNLEGDDVVRDQSGGRS